MWKFEVNWNRKLAAKGWATAAFANEMIRGAAVGNFVGLDCNAPPATRLRRFKVGAAGAWPALDSILEMPIGGTLEGFVSDETGRLTWSLIRIADNGEWNQ